MNIEFQCGGLILLVIIMLLFIKEKKLGITNSKLFFFALISCIVCEVFDIASIIAIHEAVYNGFSDIITKITCKLYLCSLVLQGYQGFLYASSEALYAKRNKRTKIFCLIFFILGEIAILTNEISYYMDGRTVYSYGPSTKITYAIAVVFITLTIWTAFKYREGLMKRRRNAMLIWQGCWLLAAIVQFIFPQLLLVGFAAAVGMVILYAELENPNEFTDRGTGLFTPNAMKMFVKDMFLREKKFSAIFFKAKFVYETAEYEIEQAVTQRIVKAIGRLGEEPAFKLDDNLYAIIYEDEKELQKKFEILKKMADSVTDVKADGMYILIPDSSVFESYEEFFLFQRYYEDAGPGIITVDEATIEKIRKRENTRIFIDNALRDDRVQVFYQPFFDTKKGYYTVAEALVRVFDENGRIVPPMEIIPIAEENGQIMPLGIRIFEKVCEFLEKGEAQKLGIEYIEVNISAAQFDHENPYLFVTEIMRKHNIKAEWINLEITETASNDLKHVLLLNMNKLISEGIEFSLDDFGTGRSNLDYFVNMPVKNIKFDYSFTQGFFTNDKIKQVMTGMTDILHNMNMHIVSEGIETKEQMDAMIDLNIEYIQGYYLSKPINEIEFIEFLKEKNKEYVGSYI